MEGAARSSAGDKSRSYAIARGEAVEACAAVEIAARCGEGHIKNVEEVLALTNRLYAMLSALMH